MTFTKFISWGVLLYFTAVMLVLGMVASGAEYTSTAKWIVYPISWLF